MQVAARVGFGHLQRSGVVVFEQPRVPVFGKALAAVTRGGRIAVQIADFIRQTRLVHGSARARYSPARLIRVSETHAARAATL
jgi:hypothetical protein